MWAAALLLLGLTGAVSSEAPACLPSHDPSFGPKLHAHGAHDGSFLETDASPAAKGVFFQLETAFFSLPSDGISAAVANQGEVLRMFAADVAEVTHQTSNKIRAYTISADVSTQAGREERFMKVVFSFTDEATPGSAKAFAAGAPAFAFERTNKAIAPHKATFVSTETTRSLNTCAFCRRFLQNLAAGKTAKCADAGENAAACKEQLEGLETDCLAATNETCCKASATALAETVTPTADKCAKAVCPPVVPVCPVNTKLKCRKDWESCCFDPTTDCSSDACVMCNSEGKTVCHDDAVCQSTGNAVQCTCKKGFTGDGKVCIPIDNCNTDHTRCGANAHCIYAGPGRHKCACNAGFSTTDMSDGGVECSAINMCSAKENGGCSPRAMCNSTGPGVATCTCNSGYEGSGQVCDAVNLCESSTIVNGGCHPLAKCRFVGSMEVQCQCPEFHIGDGKKCEPVVPCKTNPCDEHASCHNTGPGKKLCLCNSGYSGSGETCSAIDICSVENLNQCSFHAKCSYLAPGQSQCTCNAGYSGDGVTCAGINSCEHNFGGCHKRFGICRNIGVGNNTCHCINGYFKEANTTTCRKINMCDAANGRGGCHKNAECTSTGPATSSCSCNKGYFGDGKQCTEINRCSDDTHSCSRFADCMHTGQGNYQCTCWPDYSGNGTDCQKMCDKTPSDCRHGSVLHPNYNVQCKCIGCPAPWTGEFCDKCGLRDDDCNGGKANTVDCVCEHCPAPWGGPRCDVCTRRPEACQHGSTLNPVSCTCQNCSKYVDSAAVKWAAETKWAGDLCDKCQWGADTCQSVDGAGKVEVRGKFDPVTCSCKKCEAPWAGEKCEKCVMQAGDCMHGSALDCEACTCKDCKEPWTGRRCEICPLSVTDCENEGDLDRDTCKCTNCKPPWTGDRCNTCPLQESFCKNGVLNKELCKCVQCPSYWKGDACGTCDRKDSDCYNGGVLDPETCKCIKCSHGYWGGDLCKTCERSPSECQHGSSLNTKSCMCDSACPFPYTGPTCGDCKLSESDCLNGGKAEADTCSCRCVHPYFGARCENSRVTWDSCKNGATFNKETQTCENCPAPFAGATCSICEEGAADSCKNGAILDLETCTCKVICKYPWEGPKCATCNRQRSDCQHGSVVDAKTCTCKCVPDEGGTMTVWEGPTCGLCKLTQVDCQHQSRLNKASCRCVDASPLAGFDGSCPGNWAGSVCETCTIKADQCKNGATFDEAHCKCKCKDGFKGKECTEPACPSDASGRECSNKGKCVVIGSKPTCVCNDRAGNKCQFPKKESGICSVLGRGHIKTFDGFNALQNKNGEFVLHKSSAGNLAEQVNVFMRTLAGEASAAVSGIAVRRKVSIDSTGVDTVVLTLNGSSVTINYDCRERTRSEDQDGIRSWYAELVEQEGKFLFPNGLTVSYTAEGGHVVTSPDGLYIQLVRFTPGDGQKTFFDVVMQTRTLPMGVSQGLCGDFDQNKNNDGKVLNETGRPAADGTQSLIKCKSVTEKHVNKITLRLFGENRDGTLPARAKLFGSALQNGTSEDPHEVCLANGSEDLWILAKQRCTEGAVAPCFAPLTKTCERRDGAMVPVGQNGCSDEPVLGRFRPATCHQCLYDFCATKNHNYVTASRMSDDVLSLSASAMLRAEMALVKSRNEVQRAVDVFVSEEQLRENALSFHDIANCGAGPHMSHIDPEHMHCDKCESNAECRVAKVDGHWGGHCFCNEGYIGTGYACTACPAGSWKAGPGNAKECNTCTAGTYQSKTASTECDACPANTYSDTGGAVQCTKCGKFASSVNGSSSCKCIEDYSEFPEDFWKIGNMVTQSGAQCVAIDNCKDRRLHRCSLDGKCTNTGPGKNKCTCNQGYSGDGVECVVNDNCFLKLDKCAHICNFTGPATHECLCKWGYSLNKDGDNCDEVDSCPASAKSVQTAPGRFVDHLHSCDSRTTSGSKHATCTKTGPGTFSCACNAPDWEGDGEDCDMFDFCQVNHGGCDKDASCAPIVGRGSCTCNNGYRGDGKVCTEIDPCADGTHDCDVNAKCKYTGPGKHSCTCKDGFRGTGQQCTAIDRCADKTDDCDKVSSSCKFTGPGSFSCSCKTGYRKETSSEASMLQVAAANVALGRQGPQSCVEINNCLHGADKNGGCGSAGGVCTKTGPGTHTCTCAEGYKLCSFGDAKSCAGKVTAKLFGGKLNIAATPMVTCSDIDLCVESPNGGCTGPTNAQPTCEQSGPGTRKCRCAAGTARADGSKDSCKQCSQGAYSAYKAKECTVCAPGKSTAKGVLATSAAACTNCAMGKYSSATGAGQECKACPAHSITTAAGASSCKCDLGYKNVTQGGSVVQCAKCEAGSISTSLHVTACTKCPAGKFNDGADSGSVSFNTCQTCPANTFADKSGSTKCEPCYVGASSPAGSSKCTCPKGYVMDTVGKKCQFIPPPPPPPPRNPNWWDSGDCKSLANDKDVDGECTSWSPPWHSKVGNRDALGCAVLVETDNDDCDHFCSKVGRRCLRAQDNVGDDCKLDKDHERRSTKDNGCKQEWNNQVCVCSGR